MAKFRYMKHNPIICAIDTNDLSQAKQLVEAVNPHVGAIKLGLEFFSRFGAKGVEEVAAITNKIFLDLKFHDIPNTVAGAVASILPLNIMMTTIHAGGGLEMMQRAKEAALKSKTPPMIIGVTVLTSFADIKEIGVEKAIAEQVKDLAALSLKAGIDGVVCSPHEIKMLKSAYGDKLKLIVPGIRFEVKKNDDQKRTMTPLEAIQNGADYLVIGRPITEAEDPAKAAQDILKSINN